MFVEDTKFSEPEDLGESRDGFKPPSHSAASQQVALTSPGITTERERDRLQTLGLAFTPGFAAERVSPL